MSGEVAGSTGSVRLVVDLGRSWVNRRLEGWLLAMPTAGVSIGLVGLGAYLYEQTTPLDFWMSHPSRQLPMRVGAFLWLGALAAGIVVSIREAPLVGCLLPVFLVLVFASADFAWAAARQRDPFGAPAAMVGARKAGGLLGDRVARTLARAPQWLREAVALEWTWALGLALLGSIGSIVAAVVGAFLVSPLLLGGLIALYLMATGVAMLSAQKDARTVRVREERPYPPPIPYVGWTAKASDGQVYVREGEAIYRFSAGQPAEIVGYVRGARLLLARGTKSPVCVAEFDGAVLVEPRRRTVLAEIRENEVLYRTPNKNVAVAYTLTSGRGQGS